MPKIIVIESDDAAVTEMLASLSAASRPRSYDDLLKRAERLEEQLQGWDDQGETPVEAVARMQQDIACLRRQLHNKDDEAKELVSQIHRRDKELSEARRINAEIRGENIRTTKLYNAVIEERAELRNVKVASDNVIGGSLERVLADAKAKIAIYEGRPDEVPPEDGRPGGAHERKIAYLSDIIGCYKAKLLDYEGGVPAGKASLHRTKVADIADAISRLSLALHDANGTLPGPAA